MFRSYFRRIPVTTYHVDKNYMTTVVKKGSLIENCLAVLGRSIDLIGIHGPTVDEVTKDIDLTDKTCLITGANSGIGLEMTKCLSSRNCNVLMACRNPYAANIVAKNVCGSSERLKLYEINLASLRSVKKCSNEILKDQPKIDIVILNAAVFGLPWTLTEDSLETTFQVNYLSQYVLLMNIEKILAPNARVVLVSSESHRHVSWDFNHQLSPTQAMVSLPKHEYTSIRAYNISKLCGIHFMHYLSYRWLNSGKSVFCAHPGSFVKTRLCRNWWPYELLYTTMKPFSKSISQAASTPIYCATSPDLDGLSDAYYKDCKRCEESDLAQDLHLSFRIYDLTKAIVRNRIAASEDVSRVKESVTFPDQTKHSIDENTLVANYTG
ncbi:WW domain-containing oxidoreductase isoform X1 [Helicoverpa armigera]|uniref:WW domain-containing oxidoreductase isoform X1 n=2 Tax=Helicoverpa armigera TaxID=29058 RepID=UPI0030830F73